MTAYEIIDRKKKGKSLSQEEISYMVEGFLGGEVPDYQFSAFLMAIYFQGMDDMELSILTAIMRDSGDVLTHKYGCKTVDKHSTGGVGDKTTLIVLALAASAGVKIPKMSGRGLGHTGGTIDKLESIPGFRVELSPKELEDLVERVGAVVIGQSGDLAPADKKIYALRDVTATVDSIPLIASSIMSKKLASGSDALVLDVKLGSGAFMKSLEEARDLASKMVQIGKNQGMEVSALISNMDQPLGRAVGNKLEIREVVETLKGQGPEDLEVISLELASHMISLGLGLSLEESRLRAEEELISARAYDKFMDIISGQGGDLGVFEDLDAFIKADYSIEVRANKSGLISHIDAELVGRAAKDLGAGRDRLDQDLDYEAGIYMYKKVGDRVKEGDVLALLQTSNEDRLGPAQVLFAESLEYDGEIKYRSLILDIVN